jgi:hypothetical protein
MLAAAMSHHTNRDDSYEVLGESEDCCIYRCEHGCLHLQLGDLNIRLEDERFADLAAAVEEAASKILDTDVRWQVVRGPAH